MPATGKDFPRVFSLHITELVEIQANNTTWLWAALCSGLEKAVKIQAVLSPC